MAEMWRTYPSARQPVTSWILRYSLGKVRHQSSGMWQEGSDNVQRLFYCFGALAQRWRQLAESAPS
jgi:hypothetical protein